MCVRAVLSLSKVLNISDVFLLLCVLVRVLGLWKYTLCRSGFCSLAACECNSSLKYRVLLCGVVFASFECFECIQFNRDRHTDIETLHELCKSVYMYVQCTCGFCAVALMITTSFVYVYVTFR